MKEVLNKQQCSGCTACMNICPVKAITMWEDNDGFKYPRIDEDKCINCGKCQKICPVINTNHNNSLNNCYVAYAKDNNLKEKSSSGGIFPLLAYYILNQQGIVIGATLEKGTLKHIAIKETKDLTKLQGSKYLQSELGNIFTYIKDNLPNTKILFVGTPCQVAGLKAFIPENSDNLICLDFFCRGIPTPKLFKKYIAELEREHNENVQHYNFRDKSTGWDNYSNSIKFKTKIIKEKAPKNNYMKLFLSNFPLRNSCYDCNFKLRNKYSDLTLGDFWGVKKYYPKMYEQNGVSAVIINTEKGQIIFNAIKNDLVSKECLLNEIARGNSSLIKSCSKPTKREEFFQNMNKLSTSQLAKKYCPNNYIKKIIKKIKILKGDK